jgi:hypothetical protein
MSTRAFPHPYDRDTTCMEIDPAPRKPTSKWHAWKRAIIGTLGAIGIYLAAVLAIQPTVTPQPGPVLSQISAYEYRVATPYEVVVSIPPKTWAISIAEGFRTDGASIPAKLQYRLGLEPTSPCLIRGAVVHDALYNSEWLDRPIADAILLKLILEDGAHPDKARAVHRAVSDCGGVVWSRHTAGSVEAARRVVKVEEIQ